MTVHSKINGPTNAGFSNLEAELDATETFTISGFDGTGEDLDIVVDSIDLTERTANITIVLRISPSATPSVSALPSESPSNTPSFKPSVSLLPTSDSSVAPSSNPTVSLSPTISSPPSQVPSSSLVPSDTPSEGCAGSNEFKDPRALPDADSTFRAVRDYNTVDGLYSFQSATGCGGGGSGRTELEIAGTVPKIEGFNQSPGYALFTAAVRVKTPEVVEVRIRNYITGSGFIAFGEIPPASDGGTECWYVAKKRSIRRVGAFVLRSLIFFPLLNLQAVSIF